MPAGGDFPERRVPGAPPVRFDGHLILAEKDDALRLQQIALQLLQPERAPPDAQAPLTIVGSPGTELEFAL